MAAGALLTTGTTMVGDYLPEEKRAATLGLLGALGMVSALLSLPVAGFIGNGGWRLPFLLYLVVAPLILLALPSALPVPGSGGGEAERDGTRTRWFTGLPFGLLVLALAVGNLASVPGIYISFHLASLGLGKSSTVGLLVMTSSIIAAGSSAIFGKLWAKSPKFVYCVEFAAIGISMIALAYAPGLAIVVIAMILMGLGMGLLVPSVMTRAVDTENEALRGKVVGIVQGTLAVAPLLGLTLLEPLLPTIGTRGALLAVAGLSFCLLAGFATWRRR
jgi:MFS family permease